MYVRISLKPMSSPGIHLIAELMTGSKKPILGMNMINFSISVKVDSSNQDLNNPFFFRWFSSGASSASKYLSSASSGSLV